MRTFATGEAVADDVDAEEASPPPGDESGESQANTAFIDTSSAFCRSRYTRKELEAHPPVFIIWESVAPEFRIAVAAPRLKQCVE